MKSIGDRWPFLRSPSKKQLAAREAQHQRELLKSRARVAARLDALQTRHDEKMAQAAKYIFDKDIAAKMTPEIFDRIVADLAKVALDGPLKTDMYIINEEQELTDV